MKLNNEGILDKQQIEAISENGSVFLVACPGSGKTRTLVHKIEEELSKLTSSREFIVAITYTNIAADEIKERVNELGNSTSQLWIGTIHSFCLEWILRPYSAFDETLKRGIQIIDPDEKTQILDGLCKKLTNSNIKTRDCDFLATLSGYESKSEDVSKRADIEAVLSEYITIVEGKGQLDYEMILYKSLRLLNKFSVISSTLSKLFKIFLVDEYQDTKEIQYHIIAEILKIRNGRLSTFIVGDPNQSIYQNLGGYPMRREDFESLVGFNIIKKELQYNYRSSLRIINYFNEFKTTESDCVAVGKNKDYPSVITFNRTINKTRLIEEIVRLLEFNIKEHNISPNEICIAAPQWTHLTSVTRKLMTALPGYSFNGPGLVPFFKDYDNIWFKFSRILLTEPSPEMYLRRLAWSSELLGDMQNAGATHNMTDEKEFLKVCNSLRNTEENGLTYLTTSFQKICQMIGISIESNSHLDSQLKCFVARSKERIKKIISEGNIPLETTAHFRRVFKPKQGITVSTIHGVKGEEYDTVIGFGLLEGFIPHFSDQNGQINAKKQLYVLCSRARKNLHLISESGRLKGHTQNEYTPTKCLSAVSYDYNSI